MNFVETFAELDKLYKNVILEEKYDTRLAKVLGGTIERTSNSSGQGKKFAEYINFLKEHKAEYGLTIKSFIAVHHLDGNHSNDVDSNIAFVVFENHSKYHNMLVSIADEWLEGHPFYRNRYDTLDFLARVKQINTLINACNKKYKDHPDFNRPNDNIRTTPIQKLSQIAIETDDVDYIKKMFAADTDVQKAISDKVKSQAIKIIPLLDIKAAKDGAKN